MFSLTEEAKDFLLLEGTDLKYGARHLKRAVDRHLVHPMSNLIATGQVRGGDLLRVDYSPASARSRSLKTPRTCRPMSWRAWSIPPSRRLPEALATGAAVEPIRAGRTAKTSNKR